MAKLVIWGAGGHGKVVLDCASEMRRWSEIVVVDDAPDEQTSPRMRSVLATSELDRLRGAGFTEFVIAIGDNGNRARCYTRAAGCGLTAATLIHPSAFVSASARVDPGTVILPLAAVNADAHIGVNCIINTGSIIEHDCAVGEHSHIAPGAKVGGAARIGANCLVGMNASILPLVEVGAGAVVGAGSVVLKSVPCGETVVGNPAASVTKGAVSGAVARCS